jgi:excisionase family DNA binding protein
MKDKMCVQCLMESAEHGRSTQIIENRIATLKEAASFLKLSEKTLYKRVQARSIPFRRIGRSIRFYIPDLIAWVRKG